MAVLQHDPRGGGVVFKVCCNVDQLSSGVPCRPTLFASIPALYIMSTSRSSAGSPQLFALRLLGPAKSTWTAAILPIRCFSRALIRPPPYRSSLGVLPWLTRVTSTPASLQCSRQIGHMHRLNERVNGSLRTAKSERFRAADVRECTVQYRFPTWASDLGRRRWLWPATGMYCHLGGCWRPSWEAAIQMRLQCSPADQYAVPCFGDISSDIRLVEAGPMVWAE